VRFQYHWNSNTWKRNADEEPLVNKKELAVLIKKAVKKEVFTKESKKCKSRDDEEGFLVECLSKPLDGFNYNDMENLNIDGDDSSTNSEVSCWMPGQNRPELIPWDLFALDSDDSVTSDSSDNVSTDINSFIIDDDFSNCSSTCAMAELSSIEDLLDANAIAMSVWGHPIQRRNNEPEIMNLICGLLLSFDSTLGLERPNPWWSKLF
jgi:hypothetical protein